MLFGINLVINIFNQMKIKKYYKEAWEFFKDSKNYLIMAVSVFVLFGLVGFLFPIFFEQAIFDFIKELSLRLEDYTTLELIWFIFFNNIRSSFFAMVLGLGLGLFPLFAAISNGYLIGFVARYSVEASGWLILWRLLPHGIFELPAIILSIGIGFRLGIEIFKSKRKQMKELFFKSLRFFFFVIFPLLVIAAIIEGLLIGLVG